MTSSHAKLVARNKSYTLSSWTAQSAWNPISMDRAEGEFTSGTRTANAISIGLPN